MHKAPSSTSHSLKALASNSEQTKSKTKVSVAAVNCSENTMETAPQAVFSKPESQFVSPHFILKTEQLKREDLFATGDEIADFMLGHQSIRYAQSAQATELHLDDLLSFTSKAECQFDSSLLSLFFPVATDVKGPLELTKKTQYLFYKNAVLRAVQLKLVDSLLENSFGLVREKRNVRPCINFEQRKANLAWLNAFSEQGSKARQALLQMIKSLYCLANQELAQNLCEQIKKQLSLQSPSLDLTEFEHAFAGMKIKMPKSACVPTKPNEVVPFEEQKAKAFSSTQPLPDSSSLSSDKISAIARAAQSITGRLADNDVGRKIAANRIISALRQHSEKIKAKIPDELGNKLLVYDPTDRTEQTHFYFRNTFFLGKISFSSDRLACDAQKEGAFKILTHKNKGSVFFQLKKKANEQNKASLSQLEQANSLTHYLDKYQHIIPAYYVKAKHDIGMISKNAGEKDGRCWARQEKVPLYAFKPLVLEIENCYENSIYFFDIKPENTMVSKVKGSSEIVVNLIDIDSTTAIIKPKEQLFILDPAYSVGFYHQDLMHKINRITEDDSVEVTQQTLSKHVNYSLLCTMLMMNKDSNAISMDMSKDMKTRLQELREMWLAGAIKPPYLSMIQNFLTHPLQAPDFKISEIINWD